MEDVPLHPDYNRYKLLIVDIADDGIATVSLNRPEALNAVDSDLHRELQEIWVPISRDERIKVIVLTGKGRAFSAGGDIKGLVAMAGTEQGHRHALGSPLQTVRLFEQMLLVPQPIISAVNGDATGFGLTLALFCDMCIVAENAQLGDPHVKVGLVAGDGSAVIWPLLVGPHRAKEYLMLGKLIQGADAAAMGLVNYAYPADCVLAEALRMARELAANPLWAVRWTKAAVNKQIKVQLQQTLELSIAYEALSMLTRDHKEAASAFAEKRKPNFTGR